MGRAAFFIRTYGCPVHCPWCDSAGTWHPEWVPKGIERYTSEELVAMAQAAAGIEFAVITGGEPAMLDLRELTFAFKSFGIKTHLETSGAFPINGTFDWVTVSPKRWKHPCTQTLVKANEFKFIIENAGDIEYYRAVVMPAEDAIAAKQVPIWLHPEWSHREDPVVLGAISDAVKGGGGIYRAGWQIHKLYQVDYRDSRSRAMVPLGGDKTKGY